MTEDIGALLKAEFERHQDWDKLGHWVGERQAQSFQAGHRAYQYAKGLEALEGLVKLLKEGRQP